VYGLRTRLEKEKRLPGPPGRSCRLMARDCLRLGSASMRAGESGVGRIRRLGEWPGYQSSQLYSMGRSCCIITRRVISTREKKSKQKGVDMKLNVMHKTGYYSN
jgi:hypothetical protein